jgi:hypothetical protein
MSWYLANETGIIDQFASNQGLVDLRIVVDHGTYPAVKDFLDIGATKNTLLCAWQLGKVVKHTAQLNPDVSGTARGLAKLLRGQRLVSITQGFTGFPDSVDAKESADATPATHAPARGLRHPDHANLIDPIKRRVKRIMGRYFRRQKAAILDDVRLRFQVGKEVKEADDPKRRAEELLPESLSPLAFAATQKEDSDYLAAIALAIKRAEDKLAADIGTDVTIGKSRTTAYLEEHGLQKLTGEIADTTKDRLRSAIAGAVQSGGTADDIVGAIKDEMAEFSDQRAELIAQTEVNSAYSWARHELADQAGLTEKMWVSESGDPCQICEDNESQNWIAITEPFEGGVFFPLQHVGCMCSCDYRIVTAGEGL